MIMHSPHDYSTINGTDVSSDQLSWQKRRNESVGDKT